LLVGLPHRALGYAIRFRRVHAAHPLRLTALFGQMTPPLRSTPITRASALLRAAPPLVSASVFFLAVFATCHFPLHPKQGSHVPCLSLCLRSCRLYTGCHRGRKQVSPRLFLESTHAPSFDSAFEVTMRLRSVHFRSSSQHLPATLKE
jgi:hypothetical protein